LVLFIGEKSKREEEAEATKEAKFAASSWMRPLLICEELEMEAKEPWTMSPISLLQSLEVQCLLDLQM
jgi:hypothetical protein